MRTLLLLLGFILAPPWGLAAELPVFQPVHQFGLLSPQDPPPRSGPLVYAISGPAPNWHIASWSIPGPHLPAFAVSQQGGETIYDSRAPEAQVSLHVLGDGSAFYVLSQNGAILPCEKRGQPDEADLFSSPNSASVKPPAVAAVLIRSNSISLASMAHLYATQTVGFTYGYATSSPSCAVNKGAPLIAVILNNLVAHQTLFYQLALGGMCDDRQAAAGEACQARMANPHGSFFSRANPFGVDDALPLLGQPWLRNHETRALKLDLLPRLLTFIQSGPAAIDHDPSHWVLGSYYNGQHIWGDVTMQTVWKQVSLTVVTH
jgi:hypothetical protein